MFGRWGASDYQDMRVETPDGPGVVKGIYKNKVHVKLTKTPGRPRHYLKKDIRVIDTRSAEEFGATALEFAVPHPLVRPAAKWALKQVFSRLFSAKAKGY